MGRSIAFDSIGCIIFLQIPPTQNRLHKNFEAISEKAVSHTQPRSKLYYLVL